MFPKTIPWKDFEDSRPSVLKFKGVDYRGSIKPLPEMCYENLVQVLALMKDYAPEGSAVHNFASRRLKP